VRTPLTMTTSFRFMDYYLIDVIDVVSIDFEMPLHICSSAGANDNGPASRHAGGRHVINTVVSTRRH
jgi:hypothetical protein